jgi:multidrug resistance efflux pump
LQSLRAEGAATRGEVDGAQAQFLQTQAEVSRTKAAAQETRLAIAQARMAVASASPVPVNAGAKQETAGSQTDIAASATSRASRTPAPFDLTVVRQLVRSGEHVEAGTDIAVVQSTASPPLVHAYLPPSQAKYAQPGRLATLHFMDGHRVRAEVQDVISEAERTPAERVSPLTPRMPSIVVRLRPQEPLPAHYRIHHLPLDVRFDWVWGQN